MYSYEYEPDKLLTTQTYRRAVRRVKAKLGFQRHVWSFLLGSVLLAGIYLITRLAPGFPTFPWLIWPLAAWGAILILHFLLVFVFSDSQLISRQHDMIDEEFRRLVAGRD